MVFCPRYDLLLGALDFDPKKFFLGSKDAHPSLWRALADDEKGKRNSRPSTYKKAMEVVLERQEDDLTDEGLRVFHEQGIKPYSGTPWEFLCDGLDQLYPRPLVAFRHEATQLEGLSFKCAKAAQLGTFSEAAAIFKKSNLARTSSGISIADNVASCDGIQSYTWAMAPALILTPLYLIAVWKADAFPKDPEFVDWFLPSLSETKGGTLLRPQRQWIDSLCRQMNWSDKDLRSRVHENLGCNESGQTASRYINAFRSGEPQTWSQFHWLVGRLGSDSKGRRFDRELLPDMRHSFAAVKLLDYLLCLSMLIANHRTDFDSMGPFQEYADLKDLAEQAVQKNSAPPSARG